MKKISEIYHDYQVMPQLKEHMYRVAAVASQLCEYHREADSKKVISACLLHDTANIIKFNLEYFPQFLEPQGLAYWKKVRDIFREKYGEEHHGTYMIAQEIGVSKRTLELIDAIGFKKACDNAQGTSLEEKICAYSDMRVGPHGVLSLDGRLTDLRGRHLKANNKTPMDDTGKRYVECLHEIEKQVFDGLTITPDAINDDSIKHTFGNLIDFVPQ